MKQTVIYSELKVLISINNITIKDTIGLPVNELVFL